MASYYSSSTEVSAGIVRGPKPRSVGNLRWQVSRNGIRTVLNLDSAFRENLRGEKNQLLRWCLAENVRLVDFDWNGLWLPSMADRDSVQSVMRDESLYPLLVCCRHGRERTGWACADFRLRQGWTRMQAYRELVAMGCRWPQRYLWLNFR